MYPVNIDTHTCYDKRKTEQAVDMIIGSKFSRSVEDPEMEYLLAMILQKHGFNVVLSTLNSFPPSQRDKEALDAFLEESSGIEEFFSLEEQEELEEIFQLTEQEELQRKGVELFNRRLDEIIKTQTSLGIMRAYLKRKLGSSIDEEELLELTQDELKGRVQTCAYDLIHSLSVEDLQLFVRQNTLSYFSGKNNIHYGNLIPGLWGMSSLIDKYEAKENYMSSERPEIRPAIMQLEIVSSIMLDAGKRQKAEAALQEYIQIVSQEDFNPKRSLQNVLQTRDL